MGLAACLSKAVATIDRAERSRAGLRAQEPISRKKSVIAAAGLARNNADAAPRNQGQYLIGARQAMSSSRNSYASEKCAAPKNRAFSTEIGGNGSVK